MQMCKNICMDTYLKFEDKIRVKRGRLTRKMVKNQSVQLYVGSQI